MSDQSTAGRLGRRLGRILLMLPYAIQNPGVSVAELSRRFGVAKKEIIDDLNLVFLCGLPGYGPGDLIDVSIDDDRIYVDMADYFAAPLRLTPGEALSLYAGGTALAELPDLADADSLRRALAKLGSALGVDGETGIGVRFEPAPAQHLATLRDALSNKRRVRLEYMSASRGELTEREVDPWGLIAALGRWYLVALDRLSGEERMFRLDRMKTAEITGTEAEVPDDFDPERYKGAFTGEGGQGRVTLEISPEAARWFGDYYPVEANEGLPDGWRRVTMVSSGDRWMATLMLQLGKDCRNPDPPQLNARARELAAAIARRHS